MIDVEGFTNKWKIHEFSRDWNRKYRKDRKYRKPYIHGLVRDHAPLCLYVLTFPVYVHGYVPSREQNSQDGISYSTSKREIQRVYIEQA